MHVEAYAAVAQMLALLPQMPASVVEVGSYNVNGSIRPLLAQVSRYLGVDRRAGPGVDIVADAWAWQPSELVDAVVCCEVLEHDARGPDLAAHLLSWLRPGGHLLLTWATPIRQPHGIDGDVVGADEAYQGWTLEAVRTALTRVHADIVWAIEDEARGDAYCLARKRP